MTVFFSIGNISLNLLYPLCFSFSCFASSMSYRLFTNKTFNFQACLTIIESIGMMLCGFLELISQKLTTPETEKVHEEVIPNMSLIEAENSKLSMKSKKLKQKIFPSVIYITLIHTFAQFSMLYLRMKRLGGFNEIFKIIKVLITGFFFCLVFKIKLYNHHIVSILMIIISIIISTITAFPTDSQNWDIEFFIGYFLEALSYGGLKYMKNG